MLVGPRYIVTHDHEDVGLGLLREAEVLENSTTVRNTNDMSRFMCLLSSVFGARPSGG
jgi:hypothetical protein